MSQTLRIPDQKKTLLRTSQGRTTFFFLYRNEKEEDRFTIVHRYTNLKCIKADDVLEINDYLTRELKLKSYSQIDEIFQINANAIETIDVSLDHTDYFRRGKTLYLNPQILKEIQKTVGKIYDRANGYSKSVFRHFFNEFHNRMG